MYRSDKKSNVGHIMATAFTMVEVLVVIAITIILFGLLIRPLVDTLRYTKDAQLQAAAQDSARKTMEIFSREIGSAAYISDNATLPFHANAANLTPPTGDTMEQYSNFLDMQVPTQNPATGGFTATATTATIAHVYNAKLDLVMARNSTAATTDLYDPTAGNKPIQFNNTSTGPQTLGGVKGTQISTTPLMFPLAPDTSMIRYFIALKNPNASYSDSRDHIPGFPVNGVSPSPDNTYVLYRAQFNPAQPFPGTTISSGNPGASKYLLFATDTNASSPTYGQPILDDPDFFRIIINPNDIDWTTANHESYAASGNLLAHNARVEQWMSIAKPIVSAPEIDMLEIPHNYDRTLAYDPAGGAFPGVAHYGVDYDPVTGATHPVERVSISFTPGAISTNAAPGTTPDDQELGVAGGGTGESAVDGLPYIPSVYEATGNSWTRPYNISLYPTPYSGVSDYFYITQAPTDNTVGGVTINAGDVVEYDENTPTAYPATTNPVYDITQAKIIPGGDLNYVPLSINEDLGTLNFSVPAIPGTSTAGSASNVFNRQWPYTLGPGVNVLNLNANDDNNDVSPLNNLSTGLGKYLDYAFITPGSLRVYGPDMTAGPNTASENGTINTDSQPVLYEEVSPNATPGPGPNQYSVDYFSGVITFAPLSQLYSSQPPTGQNYTWPGPFKVVYDYQCNMRPPTITSPIGSANQALPLSVKVSFHSRSILNVNVGVRYIDSAGSSQDVVLSNSVQVGNLNR